MRYSRVQIRSRREGMRSMRIVMISSPAGMRSSTVGDEIYLSGVDI